MIEWTYLFIPAGICFCIGIWFNEYMLYKYLILKSNDAFGRTGVKIFDKFYMIVPEDEYVLMKNLYINYKLTDGDFNEKF